MDTNVFHIIFNPNAARGKTIKRLHAAIEYLQKAGHSVEIHETEYPGHASRLAEQMIETGLRRITCAGGDGTALETINGVMRSGHADKTQVGMLPLGTGNAFLRDFNILTVKDACERILAGSTRAVDVGKLHYMNDGAPATIFFLNIVGFGTLAEAARLRHSRFRFLGQYGYHAGFLSLLPGLKQYTVQLGIDDGNPVTIHSPLLVVCNSQYTGREMRISPQSVVDDGYFELLYAEEISAMELLKLFITLPSQAHLKHPKIRHQKSSALT